MTDTIISRRYAQALFALDGRSGGNAREKHGECLAGLAEMLRMEPRLGLTLKSPVVAVAEKKAVMSKLLDLLKADAIMRNFCNLLADKNRLAELGSIAGSYGEMLDEANGVMRGRVTTAIRLTPAKQAALREQLQKKIGGNIELVFEVDPEILGGMVLTIGDKVLDSSLRAQLGNLRNILMRGM